jgi:YD repeat-containing protein
MSQAIVSGSATNYIYNALGQLVEKYGNGGTTFLVYDEAGHILGEYSSTGTLVQETVWMGDTPVATLLPNGASVSIYYVHTDHLGTMSNRDLATRTSQRRRAPIGARSRKASRARAPDSPVPGDYRDVGMARPDEEYFDVAMGSGYLR